MRDNEVVNAVVGVAGPWDEVVYLEPPASNAIAIEAATILQIQQALPQPVRV